MFNAKVFLENEGLYSPCEISIEDLEELENLNSEAIKISIFCVNCSEKRVFSVIPNLEDESAPHRLFVGHNVFETPDQARNKRYERIRLDLESGHLRFICAYDNEHHFEVLVKIIPGDPDIIMKTGQFPSLADIEKPELKKYKTVLPENYLCEYSRALGLFAHGVGIGSFIYLRRIFEKLMLDAFARAKEEGKLTEDDFNYSDAEKHQRRMEDKIKLLKSYLPNVIVENAGIYAILSVGIHELSEEQCLKYFPVVDDGIQFMLDDYLEKMSRKKREAGFAKDIAKIKGEVK